MKTRFTHPALAALALLASAPVLFAVSASADTSTSAPAPPASSAPVESPADSATTAAIAAAHKAIESAEKSNQFDAYRKAFNSLTTADFNFNNARHVSYSRDQFLKGKQIVMADTVGSPTVTWKVQNVSQSSLSKSVTVTAVRDFSGSVHDTAGMYGTAGATHAVTSHAEYWEHWVQASPGADWKMDDWDVTSLRETVDGKVFAPTYTPSKSTPTSTRQQQYRTNTRTRQPVVFGGQTHSF